MALIEDLISEGWLKTPRIIQAFRAVKRADFLPEDSKALAEVNSALPIGQGQTISQPLVVAFMLELLEPREGEKILDIGAGSGWTTALLAHIVGQKGRVVGLEVLEDLAEFGKKNVEKYGFLKSGAAKLLCVNGSHGYPSEAPYDKILVSASLKEKSLPLAWREQLKTGGKIVVPIQNSIWEFTKKGPDDFEEKEYSGFIFVPFVQK